MRGRLRFQFRDGTAHNAERNRARFADSIGCRERASPWSPSPRCSTNYCGLPSRPTPLEPPQPLGGRLPPKFVPAPVVVHLRHWSARFFRPLAAHYKQAVCAGEPALTAINSKAGIARWTPGLVHSPCGASVLGFSVNGKRFWLNQAATLGCASSGGVTVDRVSVWATITEQHFRPNRLHLHRRIRSSSTTSRRRSER